MKMEDDGDECENVDFNANDIVELPDDHELNTTDEVPLQLIEFKGKNFVLNQKALDKIRAIEEDVIVVSIVGKARTGKSYLMNLLLNNIGKKGFDVASTINSCTRGLWIWGNTRTKQDSNCKIIFIDSEGTSSVDLSTKTYDSKIFALIVLISSLFLYNTNANIDEKSISELSLAAHLSNSIACSTSVDKESLIAELAPKFIWVIRDFGLEKIHPDTGKKITSNEYLEICLKNKISGKNSIDNNLIRENIIKYFRNRECITLPRPVESEEELQNLKSIPFEKLKPNFRAEYLVLKNILYREATPKRINGIKLNGLSLANLIVEFVNAINSGVVPNISNAWDNVISEDIKIYSEKALNIFKVKCNDEKRRPAEYFALVKFLYDAKYAAVLDFDKVIMLNSDIATNETYSKLYKEAKRKIDTETDTIMRKIIQEISEKRKKQCQEIAKNDFNTIYNKIFQDQYNSTDNFQQMREDYDKLFSDYKNAIKNSSHSMDLMQILTSGLSDRTKEMVHYIDTTIRFQYNTKVSFIETQLKQNKYKMDSVEDNMRNLTKINKGLESRIYHFEVDLERKKKEIEFSNNRIQNLENEKEILSQINKKKELFDSRKRQSVYGSNNERYSSNNYRIETQIITEDRDCECKCLIF